MVAQPIWAIHRQGQLQPLEPLDLYDGEEIQIVIVSEKARIEAALSDLLVPIRDDVDDELDEDALMREIENTFAGQKPLSETIIEERQEGP
jgi:predicted DNA-binding antitoxin AbrB/MazE fold protein